MTPVCERAIEDALHYENALLKFISPNDAGITLSHQCGYYLPKGVWRMYTPHPPVKGRIDKHPVSILWQDGRTRKSTITWYGDKSRSEYRLTRFGRDFPFLNEDVVGDLLVLIPKSLDDFLAYVLDYDDDIEEMQTALGVEAFTSWGIYQKGIPQQVESEDECIDRRIREFSSALTAFPTGEVFSETTRRILQDCLKRFQQLRADDALVRCYKTEYQVFQSVERLLCQNEVTRLFKNVDDFLRTAASIMNRRKARAGRSFENHVEHLLAQAQIPHKMRPSLGAHGKPDILIPDETAYYDKTWPDEKLFIVGLKTTCKDRWRQVLNEGHRIPTKYILTLQQGITNAQLKEMQTAGVTLVVPQSLHKNFPLARRADILSVETFIQTVRQRLN
jgi:EcoRII C terminal/Restriction endonuclease EcoRII, N-terminal